MIQKTEEFKNLRRTQTLAYKVEMYPHPWYGTVVISEYLKKEKESLRKLVVLTKEQKQILYPSPSWADNRIVKMPKLQLQQALTGNIMWPGEEAYRLSLMK